MRHEKGKRELIEGERKRARNWWSRYNAGNTSEREEEVGGGEEGAIVVECARK